MRDGFQPPNQAKSRINYKFPRFSRYQLLAWKETRSPGPKSLNYYTTSKNHHYHRHEWMDQVAYIYIYHLIKQNTIRLKRVNDKLSISWRILMGKKTPPTYRIANIDILEDWIIILWVGNGLHIWFLLWYPIFSQENSIPLISNIYDHLSI